MRTIIILTFILLGSINWGYSQCCPYLGEMKIHPESPSAADSVYLITNVTTPNVGLYLGYEVLPESGDGYDLTVRACYWPGLATALTDFTDTINLGLRPAGMQGVNFVALSSADFETCTPNDSNTVVVSFEVSGTNTTRDPADGLVLSCFPNPLTTGQLQVQAATPLLAITIVDAQGAIVRSVQNVATTNYLLPMEDLPLGCYFVRVHSSDGRQATQKVIKLE